MNNELTEIEKEKEEILKEKEETTEDVFPDVLKHIDDINRLLLAIILLSAEGDGADLFFPPGKEEVGVDEIL
ncbi:uncharacterized protein LOC119642467 isoform X2 [Glossina fuscipes]|uniref:Uncharacterized protein LOC119642467 isoform X2 n=1 Tax=Glossina fuscipes TaxID=7396 RepID=A0A9C5ZK83_9MUSC|nr:uncharacterized protein LOC119642467 isoform X2 [Glossina fuscipes]